jgi:hypothetical protein
MYFIKKSKIQSYKIEVKEKLSRVLPGHTRIAHPTRPEQTQADYS